MASIVGTITTTHIGITTTLDVTRIIVIEQKSAVSRTIEPTMAYTMAAGIEPTQAYDMEEEEEEEVRLTLNLPNKLSSAIFLICFIFQRALLLLKVGEDV